MKRTLPVYITANYFPKGNRFILIKYLFLFLLSSFLIVTTTWSQSDPAYLKTITDRSVKIVNTLSVTDSSVYNKAVQSLVPVSYTHLDVYKRQTVKFGSTGITSVNDPMGMFRFLMN